MMVEGLKQMRGFLGLSKSQEKVVLSWYSSSRMSRTWPPLIFHSIAFSR